MTLNNTIYSLVSAYSQPSKHYDPKQYNIVSCFCRLEFPMLQKKTLKEDPTLDRVECLKKKIYSPHYFIYACPERNFIRLIEENKSIVG